jgi:hypothetical protein
VEVILLQQLGATAGDLRWLIYEGYAHHALERTTSPDKRRIFGPLDPAVFTDRSCVVLTQAGAGVARSLSPQGPALPEVPCYHRERGELLVCGLLVKRLRQPALDQRLLLFNAFQDQHWPFRIANPLSPHELPDHRKVRLNHTIYRVNQHQANSLIRFGGDGTGDGVIWQPWGPNRLRT